MAVRREDKTALAKVVAILAAVLLIFIGLCGGSPIRLAEIAVGGTVIIGAVIYFAQMFLNRSKRKKQGE